MSLLQKEIKIKIPRKVGCVLATIIQLTLPLLSVGLLSKSQWLGVFWFFLPDSSGWIPINLVCVVLACSAFCYKIKYKTIITFLVFLFSLMMHGIIPEIVVYLGLLYSIILAINIFPKGKRKKWLFPAYIIGRVLFCFLTLYLTSFLPYRWFKISDCVCLKNEYLPFAAVFYRTIFSVLLYDLIIFIAGRILGKSNNKLQTISK